jgi:hypothetical protein
MFLPANVSVFLAVRINQKNDVSRWETKSILAQRRTAAEK